MARMLLTHPEYWIMFLALVVTKNSTAQQTRASDVLIPNATYEDQANLSVLRDIQIEQYETFSVPVSVAVEVSAVIREQQAISDSLHLQNWQKEAMASALGQSGIDAVQLLAVDTDSFAVVQRQFSITASGRPIGFQLNQPKSFMNRPVLYEHLQANALTAETSWFATLGGETTGFVNIVSNAERQVRGSVMLGNELFDIQASELGTVVLAHVSNSDSEPDDDSLLFTKPDVDPFADEEAAVIHFDCSVVPEGGPVVIDIVVGYSSLAAENAWSMRKLKIREVIKDQIAVENRTLKDSGIDVEIRLSGDPINVDEFAEIATPDSGISAICKSMDTLRRGEEGSAALLNMRKNKRADVAVIVTHHPSNTNCGYASAIGTTRISDAVLAVNWQCLFTGKYSLIHEIGHLVGAQHSVPTGIEASGDPKFAHGYVNDKEGAKFVTIMASRDHCQDGANSCTRIGAWSSPTKFWYEYEIGSEEHNNSCMWHSRGREIASLSSQLEVGEPAGQNYARANCGD